MWNEYSALTAIDKISTKTIEIFIKKKKKIRGLFLRNIKISYGENSLEKRKAVLNA